MDADEDQGPEPIVPLIIGAAMFMQSLTATIIAAALPVMADALNEPVLALNLTITAYIVSAAVFLPVSGWLADRFGARATLLAAVCVFVFASVLCGFSRTLEELVGARILQGAAGAMLLPVGRLVLLRVTPKQGLVRALSYLAIPMLIGPAIGPPLGGFIVTYFSWPWIFFINVPVGVLGALLIMRFVQEVKSESPTVLDVPGVVLSATALACTIYGLENIGGGHISRELAAAILAVGLGAAAGYVFYAVRVQDPILQLSLFRIQTFSAATLGGFFMRLMIGGTPFLLVLLFQVGFGMSPLTAGWFIFAIAIGALLMRFTSIQMFRRFGFRMVLIVNGALASLSYMAIAFLRPSTSYWLIAALLILHGYLRSVQMTGLNALAYADIDSAQMASSSTLTGVFQMLAQAVAVGGAAALLYAAQGAAPQLLASHIYPVFLIIGVLSLASLVWFMRLPASAGASLRD